MTGNGKWLSKPAVLWVLDQAAPDVPPNLLMTLVAVARYAGEDGCGSYPSAATIAFHTNKSERQAKKDIAALEKAGLLARGDQRIVAYIRADRRPTVWDLPLDRWSRGELQDTPHGVNHTTPRNGHGVNYRTARGELQGHHGVSHSSPEQSFKSSGTVRASRARAGGARAGAPETQPPAPPLPCAYCRSDDHGHCRNTRPFPDPPCPCPCITGDCGPCAKDDHDHCTGLAYWSSCGGSPCECFGCETSDEERKANWHKHCAECPQCARIEWE